MKLCNVKIGDKFFIPNEDGTAHGIYLVIDMKLSQMSLTTRFPEVVCAVSLTDYKVMCFDPELDVIVEYDNVFI
jgi:hypothetical protein